MSSPPSTQWQEHVAPDEEARFTRLAEQLRELQRRRSRKAGAPGRALHRKPHVGVEASFEVLGDLPDPARQGLFAQPGRYRAYVRFSNGASAHQADRKGDVRGIAIKLLGVAGAKLIPGLPAATTQDFLAIQSATVPFRGPDEFVRFVRAAATPATALPVLLFGVGPRRLFAVGGALQRSLSVPVRSLATMTFHSALPVRWGAYAGKYRLIPVGAAPAADGKQLGRDRLAAASPSGSRPARCAGTSRSSSTAIRRRRRSRIRPWRGPTRSRRRSCAAGWRSSARTSAAIAAASSRRSSSSWRSTRGTRWSSTGRSAR